MHLKFLFIKTFSQTGFSFAIPRLRFERVPGSQLAWSCHSGRSSQRSENFQQTALLFQLAKRFPHMVDVWQVASSSEGRNIYAIKVMHCYLKDAAKRFSFAQIGYPSNTKKPILWIDAGIHAREWIAHSTALYIIWQVREVCHQKSLTQPQHNLREPLSTFHALIVKNFTKLSARLFTKV